MEIFANSVKNIFATLKNRDQGMVNDSHLAILRALFSRNKTLAIISEFAVPSSARSVVFGLSLDLHVLSYFVDYSRTGSGCALEQARLFANAISDNLA